MRAAISAFFVFVFCLTSMAAFAADPDFHKQPPFTGEELKQFMTDFPAYREWAIANKDSSGPAVASGNIPSFNWTLGAETYLKKNTSWEPSRFFYVMTHVFAGFEIIKFGDMVTGENRPPDMPVVPDSELVLLKPLLQGQ
ncbi:hypothetical protein [Oleidesulfovibrio sp.]|uniref:hypothetical protein n=1 Tax=Oleidesulfovibrio sp. TaxID=2909707 RepID=UPI003A8C8363